MANLEQFMNQWQGKLVPSCGGITGQCVSLVQQWAQANGVSGCPVFPVAAAKDMVNSRPDAFIWTANTPTGVPKSGDIVVFNGRVGGGYGHTGVVTSANTSILNVFQQNDPYGSGGHQKQYNYNNVSGWLAFKNNQGGDDMVQNGENEFARANQLHQQLLGRPLGRDVFAKLVGKSWLNMIEIFSDHTDTQNRQAEFNQVKAQVGIQATQIADLTKQIEALKKQLGNATGIDPTTQAQIAETHGIVTYIKDLLNKIFKGDSK